jgi:ATP-dependent Clp protease ATP-binding subunit ClpC
MKEHAQRLAERVRGQFAETWRPSEPQSDAAAPAQLSGPTIEAAPEEPLSMRLQQLDSVFGPAASGTAHPRDIVVLPPFQEAVRLLASPNVPLDAVVQYALGASWTLACAALAALKERADGGQATAEIVMHLDKLYPWPMYFALAYFAAVEPRPSVGAPLARAKDWWCDNAIIPGLFREYLAEREKLGDAPVFGDTAPPLDAIAPVRAFLERISHPYARALIDDLQRLRQTTLDREFLASFGRFWDGSASVLVEPEPWREGLDAAEAAARGVPPRSLLVSGDARTGKTSFLRLLAKRLEANGWTVFEASGADLMAGQQWFGQLEGRIQRTIEELATTKKVIWYIPDILQIAMSGTHQGQAASILDQILPAISAGRLVIWTEASPAGTVRVLRLRPTLRTALEVLRMEPLSPEETSDVAHAMLQPLAERFSLTIDPECVDTALSTARQYLSAHNLPGSVLDLLKLTVCRAAKERTGTVDADGVIHTLAQLTGLPTSLLDNKERVDLGAIRTFFSSCVMGQDEAVNAIVERIAMLKAGLNDPGKPIGVFLFAGPTGTGKTELAKTAAEFLFGSADRLIRLDMSELQTADSTFKILGSADAHGDGDSLIARVRKQPFSVVLLDEFEKAHANVWDLFLQVFDDGRLTDTLGHVADFRHCLIILTTNLGATSHRTSGLGFAPTSDDYSGDHVLRAIGQTFRPEFQNRLDKVIVFHPLSRDLMRDILGKELNRVLERRGLKDRDWAVEWEASAQEFLIEKGFSPEMGARPLKRAIEQYVIAPLAATIVEKRFPEGDQFVFFRSDGRAIQAEFVDPDGSSGANGHDGQAGELRGLPGMILAPEGTPAEVHALAAEHATIAEALAAPEWEDLKHALAQEMAAPAFWSRPDRHDVLARLALMDRVSAAARTAEALRARLAKGAEKSGRSSRELVGRLALQLHLVKEGIRDVHEQAPIEVVLQVEPAMERTGEREAARAWCARVLDMYRAWARNRHMQLSEVAGPSPGGLPLLLISGFGAHRCLAQEAGLHVLDADDGRDRQRATARVRIAAAPLQELPADKLRSALIDALEGSLNPHAVIRRYRSAPAPLVRNMDRSWRTGRLDAVLGGDFDLIAASQAAGAA